MDEIAKIAIKEKILSDIKALEKQIAQLAENAKPISPDCSRCDLERSEVLLEAEVMSRILNESAKRLSSLKHTLSQIDSPAFGICVECEEAINIERLKIRPESVRCVACECA